MYGAHLASISTPEEQDFINSGLGTGWMRWLDGITDSMDMGLRGF